MLTDEEKDELVARLISTEKGRKWLVNFARETGTMDKLSEAIIESIKNVGNKLIWSKGQSYFVRKMGRRDTDFQLKHLGKYE